MFWINKIQRNATSEGNNFSEDYVKIPIEEMHESQNEALIQMLSSRWS